MSSDIQVKKLEEQLSEANRRGDELQRTLSELSVAKNRLTANLFSAVTACYLPQASSCGQALDKKQRVLEKQLGDWKQKCEELMAEVEGCQKESRQHAAELFKVKTAHEECLEQMEAVRRENKAFQEEIADLTDQLSDGGKSVHELQKAKKKIEMEKEELQASLEESEAALEASLDVEVKGKTEALKLRKKLEADINELEVQVDLLTKNNAEFTKNSKKMQQQIKVRILKLFLFCIQFQSALTGRRKLEVDLQTLQQEHEELQTELRGCTDKVKKASCELARVGEELRLEQEHTLHLERAKKGLEGQIKDMSTKLDEAEQIALKGGKKIIQKLEGKVKELEMELDSEQKRHAETVKTLRKNERRLKELLFQSEEDQKTQQRMQELVERLQNKMKAYKRQVEEAVRHLILLF
ncbi:hypothetical protein XENOCAPTIV_015748 [Xenoophorus captivus]|uniref:Myosin tail domain-containing protein n=1 Tax=Xenoophorus captivus TaxID=1517983 RepID=A0ABV0R0M1_9TELE